MYKINNEQVWLDGTSIIQTIPRVINDIERKIEILTLIILNINKMIYKWGTENTIKKVAIFPWKNIL